MPKSKKRPLPKKRRVKPTSSKNIASREIARLTARSIKRLPKLHYVSTELICDTPEWSAGIDPVFEGLYKKYLTGHISGYMTRIPINSIKVGFYLPSRNFEYKCDNPPEVEIRSLMYQIQQGGRPAVFLYGNVNPNCSFDFLCPDDVVPLKAYQRLNIQAIPATVLSPGERSLPFSNFEVRTRKTDYAPQPRIRRTISTDQISSLRTIIGKAPPECPLVAIDKMMNIVRELISHLRLFHHSDTDELHYHHMIFSALIRAQESLEAIKVLIERNLWYQALALLRVLYELHLNFYFDWLQPENNYRYLALAAGLNTAGIARQRDKVIKELTDKGVEFGSAKQQANDIWLPVTMASTVADKAKLPKIGILYHEDIYSFLSQISHQNFEIASLHANRFDDEKFTAIDENVKSTYLRFMDYIVAEFTTCVAQDIGAHAYSH